MMRAKCVEMPGDTIKHENDLMEVNCLEKKLLWFRKKKHTVDAALPLSGLIKPGSLWYKLWQTFLGIFNPQPKKSGCRLNSVKSINGRIIAGPVTEQLCAASVRGEDWETFFDLVLAHLRGPAADDNDAEAHYRKPDWGLCPAPTPIPALVIQKSQVCRGWTGTNGFNRMDSCEFIPTNLLFL